MWGRDKYSYVVCTTILVYISTTFTTPTGETILPHSTLIRLAAIGLLVFFAMNKGRLRTTRESFFVFSLIICLLLLSLVSSIWSQYPVLTAQRSILSFFVLLGMFIAVFADRNPIKTFEVVSITTFFITSVLCSIGILIYFGGDAVVVAEFRIQTLSIGPVDISQNIVGSEKRISSLVYNPNTLAGMITISLPLGIGLFIRHRLNVISIGIILNVVALILTFSRTGFVTSLVSVVILFVILLREKINLSTAVRYISLMLVSVIGFIYYLPGIDRLTSISIDERGPTWRALYNTFLENIIGGIGFGVSNETILFGTEGAATSTHSDYFAVLAELGTIGFVIFLTILAATSLIGLKNQFRGNSRERLYLGVGFSIFTALCVHGIAETTMIRPGFRQLVWAYMMGFTVNFQVSQSSIVDN